MSTNHKPNQHEAKLAAAVTYSFLFLTLKPNVVKELGAAEQKEKKQRKEEKNAVQHQVKIEKKQPVQQIHPSSQPPKQYYGRGR